MTYQVLTDKEVEEYYDFAQIIPLFEKIFLEKSEGSLIAPPRFSVKSQSGSLVFTGGGSSSLVENVLGFRVYDTFPKQKNTNLEKNQLTVVFNNTSGELMGLIVGNLIGPIRTATINALAIKKMSRKDSTVLGVIGTGKQARWHIEAACAVRNITKIKVFSRRQELRNKFADFIRHKLQIETISCSTSKEVVKDADILLCLTNSSEPIFNAEDIKKGTHINTIGPKFVNTHEIPLEIAKISKIIVTDSIEQSKNYSQSFFLSGTPEMDHIQDLSNLISGKVKFNRSISDITLFCSVGLSGTEVVLAKYILKEYDKIQ